MIGRIRRDLNRDTGFSLVELIVSLSIAMVVFSAMAAAAIAGVRASVVARENQQAVDVLNEVVEAGRGVEYVNLAMVSSDLGSDPDISGGSTPTFTVPNGVGSELIWAQSTGSVSPHIVTEPGTNGIEYTVARYVTVPPGVGYDTAGQPLQKRYTVVATWTSYGKEHERVVSTLLTETQRGLPLPRYSVAATSPQTQTKNPSTILTWGFQVINRGARDTFNITASSGTWSYYVDANCNGGLDAGETTTLSNSDSATGNSAPDTGQLEPNNYPPFCVLASRAIPGAELGTSTAVFTLTSSAQPTANGAVVTTPTFTVNVTTGPVGGGGSSSGGTTSPNACVPSPSLAVQGTGTTLTAFGMKNGTAGTSGPTSTQLVNLFGQATCLPQSQDHNFSTDVADGATIGRALQGGGTVTSATAVKRGEWRWNPPADRNVNGTASATLAVKCLSSAGTATVNVALGTYTQKTGLFASKATGTKTLTCASTTNWTSVEVPLPISTAFTVKNRVSGQPQYLSMRVWTATGSANLRMNYESPTNKSFLTVSLG